MEVSSPSTNGMFSLHVLIILGITVALVSAVAVILYNKIQQQGEKLSAVMELSTVLAQEVRSHEIVLKRLQSREYPSYHDRPPSSSVPSPQSNRVAPLSDKDIVRVYVSDGSGKSDDDESGDDDESVEDVHLNMSHPPPSATLDNMLMNPMCFGHASGTAIIGTVGTDGNDSDESGSGYESSDSDDDTDDDTDADSCDTSSILSVQMSSMMEIDDSHMGDIVEINISDTSPSENLSSSPSEKRVITLSDICIDASGEVDIESDVHKVVVDSGDNVLEYKKLGVNELRRLAIERNLLDKGVKMKKGELVELLTNV
jgi:hypothetical protein